MPMRLSNVVRLTPWLGRTRNQRAQELPTCHSISGPHWMPHDDRNFNPGSQRVVSQALAPGVHKMWAAETPKACDRVTYPDDNSGNALLPIAIVKPSAWL